MIVVGLAAPGGELWFCACWAWIRSFREARVGSPAVSGGQRVTGADIRESIIEYMGRMLDVVFPKYP